MSKTTLLELNLAEGLVKNTLGYHESGNKEEFMQGAKIMWHIILQHDTTYFEMRRQENKVAELTEELDEIREHLKAVLRFAELC